MILYTTEKTHEFLKANKISSSLVYKISQVEKSPNIVDLLERRIFDAIINIPTKKDHQEKEITDGQMIRKAAIDAGLVPITDIEVATIILNRFHAS